MQVGEARSAAPWLSDRHSQETKKAQAAFAWVFFYSFWKSLSASFHPHPTGKSSKRALAT